MIDKIEKEKTHGVARSSKWSGVRKSFLKGKVCGICGGIKHLEAHHLKPFHLHPELELDPSNLFPLCENKGDGINCHLAFGHLGSFKSINVACISDAQIWSYKIKHRP